MSINLTERLEKLYASAVYDVMNGMGHSNCVLPHGINALDPAHRLAGQVETMNGDYSEDKDAGETLLAWATVLSKAPSGKVLICQPNTYEVALMGELSAETLNYRGVRGYIVDGGCRDVPFLLKNDFPVFCRFNTPKDICRRWVAESMGAPIDIGGVKICSGDYVLADIDGVVIIPQDMADAVVAATEAVASTETAMRDAILGGMDPVDAYRKFDTF
ncbi:MAG: RraA family protein [Alphaproteobacteria bacterium]|nr:RraA family protein [Alphaproteobacteria bacterium]